jgi:serine/threonine protein kinase
VLEAEMEDIPERLGKYDVLREIDRGNMGIVYLGHDPYADRPVAIKVALSDLLTDPDHGKKYRKMFFNEAHAAGNLTHPNIISIYDAGVEDETCYIVMEHIDGGKTLKSYTKEDDLLPLEKVVEIIFKCARALDYAHERKVIHRDIKPSNILMTKSMDIKIGDFSIAHVNKPDDSQTQPMGIMGSPRYMSPEQLRDEEISHHTDLFSLGVIMYELLTGRHPFKADTFSQLIKSVVNDEPVPLGEIRQDLPTALEDIVMKTLQKDTARRYQRGMDIASDLSNLFDVLEGEGEKISVEEKFNLIKELEFFKGFPEEELWEILRASSWQDYRKGDSIIIEGEMDDCFYIIISGSVAVLKNGQVIGELLPGDCFGEMGYLAKTKRTASIVAESNTSLLKINSTVISQVSLQCQVRFLKVFLRTLIYRLSATTEVISSKAS